MTNGKCVVHFAKKDIKMNILPFCNNNKLVMYHVGVIDNITMSCCCQRVATWFCWKCRISVSRPLWARWSDEGSMMRSSIYDRITGLRPKLLMQLTSAKPVCFRALFVISNANKYKKLSYRTSPVYNLCPLNSPTSFKFTYAVLIRPRRSRSAAAYGHQTFPWAICRSVCPSVCMSSALWKNGGSDPDAV